MPSPSDIATQIADTQAAIDAIELKLNSGMTQMKEKDREMRFDLGSLRDRRAELLASWLRCPQYPLRSFGAC